MRMIAGVMVVCMTVSVAWAQEAEAPPGAAQAVVAPAPVGDLKTCVLSVKGMYCSGCVSSVGGALKNLDGVVDAQVDLQTGEATVTYDPAKVTPEAGIKAVEQVGFKAEVKPGS